MTACLVCRALGKLADTAVCRMHTAAHWFRAASKSAGQQAARGGLQLAASCRMSLLWTQQALRRSSQQLTAGRRLLQLAAVWTFRFSQHLLHRGASRLAGVVRRCYYSLPFTGHVLSPQVCPQTSHSVLCAALELTMRPVLQELKETVGVLLGLAVLLGCVSGLQAYKAGKARRRHLLLQSSVVLRETEHGKVCGHAAPLRVAGRLLYGPQQLSCGVCHAPPAPLNGTSVAGRVWR